MKWMVIVAFTLVIAMTVAFSIGVAFSPATKKPNINGVIIIYKDKATCEASVQDHLIASCEAVRSTR